MEYYYIRKVLNYIFLITSINVLSNLVKFS